MSEIDADVAREYVNGHHADVLDAVGVCADAVADNWDGYRTVDAQTVADPLEACLREAGVLGALPAVLVGAVDAAGGAMRADPVAAPPYVVVTSRGPLLRATLDGGRLVVRIDAFRVTDDAAYERCNCTVTAVVR